MGTPEGPKGLQRKNSEGKEDDDVDTEETKYGDEKPEDPDQGTQ